MLILLAHISTSTVLTGETVILGRTLKDSKLADLWPPCSAPSVRRHCRLSCSSVWSSTGGGHMSDSDNACMTSMSTLGQVLANSPARQPVTHQHSPSVLWLGHIDTDSNEASTDVNYLGERSHLLSLALMPPHRHWNRDSLADALKAPLTRSQQGRTSRLPVPALCAPRRKTTVPWTGYPQRRWDLRFHLLEDTRQAVRHWTLLLIFQNQETSTWELQIKYFAKVAKMNQSVIKHNFL